MSNSNQFQMIQSILSIIEETQEMLFLLNMQCQNIVSEESIETSKELSSSIRHNMIKIETIIQEM